MKLTLAIYVTWAAVVFLAVLAVLVFITDGRTDRNAPNPWALPTVCANGECTYATPTPWPTHLPATRDALATFYAATPVPADN